MAAPYEYSALNKEQIRLLSVNRNLIHGDLDCELSIFPLNSSLKYIALSYAWGSSVKCKSIHCNGLHLPITTSVYDALYALYGSSSPLSNLPIWIDAVCINQDDQVEKLSQIRQIGQIYSLAQEVVVWLGPEAEDSDIAMDRIGEIVQVLKDLPDPVMWEDNLPLVGLPVINDPVWTALRCLHQRSWFGRLWVFQEAVLANRIRMLCGSRAIEWEALSELLEQLSRHLLLDYILGPQSTRQLDPMSVNRIESSRRIFRDREVHPSTLTWLTDRRVVRDPRDRVYGILALTPPQIQEDLQRRELLVPSNSCQELYIQYAKSVLKYDWSLTLLGLISGREKLVGLPSWCPSFDSPQHSTPMGLINNVFFQAGFEDPVHRRSDVRTYNDSNSLRVMGFRCDVVSEVVESTFEYSASIANSTEEQTEALWKVFTWEQDCQMLYRRACGSNWQGIESHLMTLAAKPQPCPRDDLRVLHQQYQSFCRPDERFAQLTVEGCSSPDETMSRESGVFFQTNSISCSGRKYFGTTAGRVGIGPPEIRAGDVICTFYGAGPIFILRYDLGQEKARLIGDGYVCGSMNLSETPESSRFSDEVFLIE